MQTWKLGIITIAIATLFGAFAVAAYGYGMMSSQYQPYNYQQGPWGYQEWRGMGMMGNNWQGMMGACHSYMNQYRYYNTTSQPNQVLIMHYSFVSNIITISAGTTVTWTNMDQVIHTVESGTHEQPTELFDSGPLYQGQSFSYTFTQPGVYVYHCDPHPYMVGMIIVQ
ncbi:MAG: cupredoxin domain-containing protein [archaeon]|nr:cupredoxin domain-containing protein [archaeon]